MILVEKKYADIYLTCPHTRGDDPIDAGQQAVTIVLSPHAWG